MGLFLSTFYNKIDKKGRVSVPASFRSVLESQSFRGIVTFRSLSLDALEGFGMDRMEKLSQDLDQIDLFSQRRDDWADALFADAQALAFDSEGRITLSQEMCQHSEITDTVAFVGRGPTFQMWNPEKFKVHQEAARQRLKEKKQGLAVA